MELLELLVGWTRVPLAAGVHLQAPAGLTGGITLLAQQRPIPRLRDLMAARSPGAPIASYERFSTLEGEHALMVTLATTAGPRHLALVIGDAAATLVDGAPGDAASAAPVARLVRALATASCLGLGPLRRRRYVYRVPDGWNGLGREHATVWLHPEFPRVPVTLTVRDAQPRGTTAPVLLDRWLYDQTRTLLKDAPDKLMPVTARGELGGVVARIAGRHAAGEPHHAVLRATFEDARFVYVAELAGPSDAVTTSVPTFSTLIESIEPIPTSLVEDLSTRVVSWSD
jgi:hypothetical protein